MSDENLVMTYLIKKRISTKLFIDESLGNTLYTKRELEK